MKNYTNFLVTIAPFAFLLWTASSVSAFQVGRSPRSSPTKTTVDDGLSVSRREWLSYGFAASLGTTTSMLLPTLPASAKALSQEELDKQNIVKGYNQLQYLLDNWETETTVCKTGGEYNAKRCDRTPIKVMDYLGYKSTDNPLFKADKTMLRLYSLVPASNDAEYLEAVERYSENADEASGMAYISSWGEANPGGGKDRVELFIERAKKNVITSRDCLATVIKILDLKA